MRDKQRAATMIVWSLSLALVYCKPGSSIIRQTLGKTCYFTAARGHVMNLSSIYGFIPIHSVCHFFHSFFCELFLSNIPSNMEPTRRWGEKWRDAHLYLKTRRHTPRWWWELHGAAKHSTPGQGREFWKKNISRTIRKTSQNSFHINIAGTSSFSFPRPIKAINVYHHRTRQAAESVSSLQWRATHTQGHDHVIHRLRWKWDEITFFHRAVMLVYGDIFELLTLSPFSACMCWRVSVCVSVSLSGSCFFCRFAKKLCKIVR